MTTDLIDYSCENHNSVSTSKPTTFLAWAVSASLAATQEIPVGFFSSAK